MGSKTQTMLNLHKRFKVNIMKKIKNPWIVFRSPKQPKLFRNNQI